MTNRTLRLGRLRAGAPVGFPLAAVVVAVVALAALLSSCGSTTVASVVRADAITVDGTSISRRDLQDDISALSSNKELVKLDKQVAEQGSDSQRLFDSAGKATRVLTTSWLNRLVNQIIIDREVKRLRLKVTAADLKQGEAQFAALFATQTADGADIAAKFPKWFREQEKQREGRLVALTHSLDKRHPISNAQMRAFYDKNVGTLCPSGRNVSHILVKTLPQAQALVTQLANGSDFAGLAKVASIDTGTAAQGGSLGCFATGQYVPEFETAATAAKLDTPTAPVKTEFGYHIILATKYAPPAFEAVEAEIRTELQKEANNLGDFVRAGLKKAKVHVAAQYGTWDAKEGRVKAPKVPEVRNSRDATTTTPTT